MLIQEQVFAVLNTTANGEFRTVLGIAALLDVEPRDVVDAITSLDGAGRIRPELREGSALPSWRTENTPGLHS